MYWRLIVQEAMGTTHVNIELLEPSGVQGEGPRVVYRRSYYPTDWSDPGDWPDPSEQLAEILGRLLEKLDPSH